MPSFTLPTSPANVPGVGRGSFIVLNCHCLFASAAAKLAATRASTDALVAWQAPIQHKDDGWNSKHHCALLVEVG